MVLGGRRTYFLQALLFDQGEDTAVFPWNILQCHVHSFLGEGEDGSLSDTATGLSQGKKHREDCEEGNLLYLKEKKNKRTQSKEIVNL